jgi:tRNA (guanine37-N1)-methyltransferase
MMRIDIITIFPDFFRGTLDYGIIRRAREAGLANIEVHDLRSFAHDRHRTVDDRPFGGGEGMVLKPEPIFECVDRLGLQAPGHRAPAKQSVILLSAQGKRFDQRWAQQLSVLDRIVLICGRYEGVDERVSVGLADCELSIGDYVLSGGELGAAVVVDCVTRLIPGAVGNEASTHQESFTEREWLQNADAGPSSTCVSGGLLDYPHYTRPAEFRGMAVPKVLASGNHDEIRRWRRRSALEKTARNRPDLFDQAVLNEEDRELLARISAKDI